MYRQQETPSPFLDDLVHKDINMMYQLGHKEALAVFVFRFFWLVLLCFHGGALKGL